MQNRTLFKTHQHSIVPVSKAITQGTVGAIVLWIVGFMLLGWTGMVFGIVMAYCVSGLYAYTLWKNSWLKLDKDRIIMDVRTGLFSHFETSVRYDKIQDSAITHNNIFHFFFQTGNIFIRSAATGVGDFFAPNIPKVEEIHTYIHALQNLTQDEREELNTIEDVYKKKPTAKKDINEAIREEKANLLAIEGIKEVVALSDTDRIFLFENEEDRNHAVYEALKRQVLLCVTHDDTFRNPDAAIVHKKGEKVIFPGVAFHEVKEKNVVSASPGLKTHEYLIRKFESPQTADATILIGFDV